MDYFQWCERVLRAYVEGARDSLDTRRSGLRPEQVARPVFGSVVASPTGFGESTRYQGLCQAIRDLDDEGLIMTDDDYYGDEQKAPGKVTDDGEQYLEDDKKRWTSWWATCATASELKPQHQELLELVNHLSPREDASYAWMEWVHQDVLAAELG